MFQKAKQFIFKHVQIGFGKNLGTEYQSILRYDAVNNLTLRCLVLNTLASYH